jgi:hypothetical protein
MKILFLQFCVTDEFPKSKPGKVLFYIASLGNFKRVMEGF